MRQREIELRDQMRSQKKPKPRRDAASRVRFIYSEKEYKEKMEMLMPRYLAMSERFQTTVNLLDPELETLNGRLLHSFQEGKFLESMYAMGKMAVHSLIRSVEVLPRRRGNSRKYLQPIASEFPRSSSADKKERPEITEFSITEKDHPSAKNREDKDGRPEDERYSHHQDHQANPKDHPSDQTSAPVVDSKTESSLQRSASKKLTLGIGQSAMLAFQTSKSLAGNNPLKAKKSPKELLGSICTARPQDSHRPTSNLAMNLDYSTSEQQGSEVSYSLAADADAQRWAAGQSQESPIEVDGHLLSYQSKGWISEAHTNHTSLITDGLKAGSENSSEKNRGDHSLEALQLGMDYQLASTGRVFSSGTAPADSRRSTPDRAEKTESNPPVSQSAKQIIPQKRPPIVSTLKQEAVAPGTLGNGWNKSMKQSAIPGLPGRSPKTEGAGSVFESPPAKTRKPPVPKLSRSKRTSPCTSQSKKHGGDSTDAASKLKATDPKTTIPSATLGQSSHDRRSEMKSYGIGRPSPMSSPKKIPVETGKKESPQKAKLIQPTIMTSDEKNYLLKQIPRALDSSANRRPPVSIPKALDPKRANATGEKFHRSPLDNIGSLKSDQNDTTQQTSMQNSSIKNYLAPKTKNPTSNHDQIAESKEPYQTGDIPRGTKPINSNQRSSAGCKKARNSVPKKDQDDDTWPTTEEADQRRRSPKAELSSSKRTESRGSDPLLNLNEAPRSKKGSRDKKGETLKVMASSAKNLITSQIRQIKSEVSSRGKNSPSITSSESKSGSTSPLRSSQLGLDGKDKKEKSRNNSRSSLQEKGSCLESIEEKEMSASESKASPLMSRSKSSQSSKRRAVQQAKRAAKISDLKQRILQLKAIAAAADRYEGHGRQPSAASLVALNTDEIIQILDLSLENPESSLFKSLDLRQLDEDVKKTKSVISSKSRKKQNLGNKKGLNISNSGILFKPLSLFQKEAILNDIKEKEEKGELKKLSFSPDVKDSKKRPRSLSPKRKRRKRSRRRSLDQYNSPYSKEALMERADDRNSEITRYSQKLKKSLSPPPTTQLGAAVFVRQFLRHLKDNLEVKQEVTDRKLKDTYAEMSRSRSRRQPSEEGTLWNMSSRAFSLFQAPSVRLLDTSNSIVGIDLDRSDIRGSPRSPSSTKKAKRKGSISKVSIHLSVEKAKPKPSVPVPRLTLPSEDHENSRSQERHHRHDKPCTLKPGLPPEALQKSPKKRSPPKRKSIYTRICGAT